MHTGKHKNEEAVLRGGFFKHHGGVFRMHYDDDALQSSHACSAALHKEWGGYPLLPMPLWLYFVSQTMELLAWPCLHVPDQSMLCFGSDAQSAGSFHMRSGSSFADPSMNNRSAQLIMEFPFHVESVAEVTPLSLFQRFWVLSGCF